MDHAGKTTLLEKVKTIFSPSQPGLNPSQISPTIGQNLGRITLSSTYLKFWDLGGSAEIRPIWDKYYDEADAICWVLDSHDRIRNGWKSDSPNQLHQSQGSAGDSSDSKGKGKAKAIHEPLNRYERGEGWLELERVLQHSSVAHSNIPVLVIANKQDRELSPHQQSGRASHHPHPPDPHRSNLDVSSALDPDDQGPMSVEEIKEMFNRLVMESERSEKARSLGLSEAYVIGVSALNGQGIREAMNWLFYRVATKGQSRKTQRLKSQQQALLRQQQQQQTSNPYQTLRGSNIDLLHRDSPKNRYIKLADLSNVDHHSTHLKSNPPS